MDVLEHPSRLLRRALGESVADERRHRLVSLHVKAEHPLDLVLPDRSFNVRPPPRSPCRGRHAPARRDRWSYERPATRRSAPHALMWAASARRSRQATVRGRLSTRASRPRATRRQFAPASAARQRRRLEGPTASTTGRRASTVRGRWSRPPLRQRRRARALLPWAHLELPAGTSPARCRQPKVRSAALLAEGKQGRPRPDGDDWRGETAMLEQVDRPSDQIDCRRASPRPRPGSRRLAQNVPVRGLAGGAR